MSVIAQTSLSDVLDSTVEGFVENIVGALPRVLTGLVFLLLAGIAIRIVVAVVRVFLRRVYRDQPIYVQLGSSLVMLLLWFGAILAFLSAVGLPDIAAAMGTASGFLALGVSYALSGMLEDAVAGLYLLRDPDFNAGDHVKVGSDVGVVEAIELRKTRLDVEGDTLVRANGKIENEWTKLEE
jgi:small-conductance mechanosensitive channel